MKECNLLIFNVRFVHRNLYFLLLHCTLDLLVSWMKVITDLIYLVYITDSRCENFDFTFVLAWEIRILVFSPLRF